MPLPKQSDSTRPRADRTTPVVWYETEAFTERIERLMAGGEHRTGTCFLFYGGTREERQQALGTLTRYATGNVHQFRMPSLLNEYRMQTQSSLRKAFDHAAEENALLFFDKVDALFTHEHADASDAPVRTAAPTTLEYFFDRVRAYTGVVVLGLQRKSHFEWTQDEADLAVRFE
jgi:SpoVK/Ycf46/Vps4 family AAA+-type ATPase